MAPACTMSALRWNASQPPDTDTAQRDHEERIIARTATVLHPMKETSMPEEFEMDAGSAIAEEGRRVVDTHGFVVIRGFFDDAALRPLWRDVHRLVDSFADALGVSPPACDEREADRRVAAVLERTPTAQPVLYDRMQQMPALLALPDDTRIREVAHTFLDTECLGVWPRVQLRLDPFSDRKNLIEWHHDYLYNQGTTRSYTFWMPLSDNTSEMGPLLVADGSHRMDDVEFERTGSESRFDFSLRDEMVAKLHVLPLSTRAGDLVVFHSLLLHSGQLNRTPGRARMSALFRIQDLRSLDAFENWRSADGR
ncbi:MAG: phytanoyl-CoA dioxygenase family protein [Aquihabitans sp.]